jgi:hypothetical protein
LHCGRNQLEISGWKLGVGEWTLGWQRSLQHPISNF